MPLQSRAGTLPVTIFLDPRVWVVDDAVERIDFHMAVYYPSDTIAGAEDRVQIMCDHDNGQLQLLLQIEDQLVELGSADRIETRSGLVQKQKLRIQCQRARQRGALYHAAGKLRRIFFRGIRGQPGEPDLEHCQLTTRLGVHVDVLDHGKLHVLRDCQGGVQRTLLEGDAVACFHLVELGRGHLRNIAAIDTDDAGLRPLQPQYAPQQDRLARPRPADDSENLVLAHVHVEAIVDDLRPEAVHQSDHLENGVDQMPISRNRTANTASAKITRKIAWTTARVVRRPSSREESRTCMP